MAGDVVDLILADHRKFEDLLRQVRSNEADRRAALAELSATLVAHAEAEEKEVYPALRRKDAIDSEESEHSKEEHAEGHEALLDLLEAGDPDSDEFGEAIENLTEELSHHMDEEERTILNPARKEVPEDTRRDLGLRFMKERQRQLDADCGNIQNVRRLVRESRQAGQI